MKTKSTLMYLMLAIMSSCQFTHYCPGYDMEDRKIITFRKNDTIRYYSDNLATKDSLVFCVKDFYNKGGGTNSPQIILMQIAIMMYIIIPMK